MKKNLWEQNEDRGMGGWPHQGTAVMWTRVATLKALISDSRLHMQLLPAPFLHPLAMPTQDWLPIIAEPSGPSACGFKTSTYKVYSPHQERKLDEVRSSVCSDHKGFPKGSV